MQDRSEIFRRIKQQYFESSWRLWDSSPWTA